MADECANPLLLGWVKEWLDAAKEQNSKSAFAYALNVLVAMALTLHRYKKAYDSIKACPLVLQHPSEAQDLRGVGPKLCDRLTENLKTHCEQNGLPMPADPRAKNKKRPNGQDDVDQTGATSEAPATTRPKKARKTQPKKYVPALRSGAYAIILALSTLPENSDSGLTKNQTISIAEAYCSSSFHAPSDPTKTYTAWSSMRTLQDKDLVFVTGGATKRYALTDEGWEVARKMREAAGLNTQLILNPNGGTEDAAAANAPISGQPSLEQPQPGRETNRELEASPVKQRSRKKFISLDDSDNDLSSELLDGTRCSQPEPSLPKQRSRAPLGRACTETDFIELISSSPRLLPAKASKLNRQQNSRSEEATSVVLGEQSIQKTLSAPIKTATVHGKTLLTSNTTFPKGVSTILLPADSYTIEMLLDNREVRSRSDRTYLQDGLLAQDIKPTTRALELGDCTWVARVHDPAILRQLGVRTTQSQSSSIIPAVDPSAEFVLDHVVERKRLDDLISSLKDGRYHEQKFRLRRSGAKHVTYLVEEVALSTEVAQRWHSGVRSALASTLVVDQFAVVRTKRLDDSIRWLARTTKALRKHYAGKTLHVLTADGLDLLEDGARTRRDADARLTALRTSLSADVGAQNIGAAAHSRGSAVAEGVFLSYPAFSSRAAKQDGLALRDVFLKMLLCTRGMSADKALAVQQIWPTPRAFVAAYREEQVAGNEDRPNSGAGGSSRGKGPALGISKETATAKRRAELLLRATDKLAGRQKIGKAVSSRVAEVWGGLAPAPSEET